MECPICLEPYTGSRGPHLPKVFSCGHSICELCLKEFSGAQLECALCRATVDAAHISTNYALCSVLDAEIAQAPSNTARTGSTTARSSSPSPKARSDVPQNNNVFTAWTRFLGCSIHLFGPQMWNNFFGCIHGSIWNKKASNIAGRFLVEPQFCTWLQRMAAPKM